MKNFKGENFTEEQKKELLKSSLTIIIENYKVLIASNNSLSTLDRQKFYNDLDHNISAIEFITNCKLDRGVLWEGIEEKMNN